MDVFSDFIGRVSLEMWKICQSLGFWLLAGFVLAGLAGQWLPFSFVERHLAKGGWKSVVKAVLLGIPLPLCSCGVIPVAAQLRRAGASRGAVAAFAAATPQTGPESIAASWSLLGLPFTIGRVLADVAAGLFAGILINAADSHRELAKMQSASRSDPIPAAKTWTQKLKDALREGLIELPAEIGKYVLVGVLVGAVLTALFPDQEALRPYLENRWVSYLAATALALPLYVCATGSIPIAYALVGLGFSPGAAIIFLVLGPATNPSAVAVLWKILGRGACALYLAALAVAAWTAAFLFDMLGLTLRGQAMHGHGHEGVFDAVFAVWMLLVFAVSFFMRRHKGCTCRLHGERFH